MNTFVKWVLYANCGLWIGAMVLGLGQMISFSETDLSNRNPYADFVGKEYWVKTEVDALAWNDFPDKAKILSISLMPPPSVRNRFVSYKIRLEPGQAVRILSAKGRLASSKYYVVSVPGAGLPEGIQITMPMNSDGSPDPHVYAALGR